jgi:hypothetical protein
MADLGNCLIKMICRAFEVKKKAMKDKLHQQLSPEAFIKEYCTVSFGLPRRGGNTVAAKKAKEYFIRQHYNVKLIYPDNSMNIANLGDGTTGDFVSYRPSVDILIFDGASYIMTHHYQELINACAVSLNNRKFMLVLVQ